MSDEEVARYAEQMGDTLRVAAIQAYMNGEIPAGGFVLLDLGMMLADFRYEVIFDPTNNRYECDLNVVKFVAKLESPTVEVEIAVLPKEKA